MPYFMWAKGRTNLTGIYMTDKMGIMQLYYWNDTNAKRLGLARS